MIKKLRKIFYITIGVVLGSILTIQIINYNPEDLEKTISENTASENKEQKETLCSANDMEDEVFMDEYDIAEKEFNNKYRQLLHSKNRLGDYEYFVRYRKLIEEYSEWIIPPNTIYAAFTDDELDYLFRMVETEVHGGAFMGKVHVADVAFNRVESERFPNDLKSVITSPGQFVYSKTNITESTILACEYAWIFRGSTNGALFFHSGCSHNAQKDCVGHHFSW